MKNTVKIILVLVVLFVLALPLLRVALSNSAWGRLDQAGDNTLIAWGGTPASPVTTPVQIHLFKRVLWSIPVLPQAQGPGGDQLVIGNNFTLSEGETLSGNLVVIGGNADLQRGSLTEGDVVMLGGNLSVDGTIEKNIVAIGGLVDLGETAVVHGDVNTLGGRVDRQAGARVDGQVNSNTTGPFPSIVLPGAAWTPSMDMGLGLVGKIIWWLFRSFAWAGLALLVVALLPDHTDRAAQVAVTQPLIAGGLGLLTAVVVPTILLVVALTIIGIPVTLVGIFALVVAWAFGVIVVSLEVGRRMAHALKQEWASGVCAAVGAFLLTLVTNGIGMLVPCVGWMAPALVGMLGLGAVLLTRFGTQVYPLEGTPAPKVEPTPLAPVEPSEVVEAKTPAPPETPGEEG